MIAVIIEEFEQGSWVADLTDEIPYAGSFTVNATDVWVGTAKVTRQEGSRYMTRVVGGGGGLANVIPDRYYDGSVSVGAAVSDICLNSGEALGAAPPAAFLNTYQRLRDTAAVALDKLAATLQLIWWIDRTGLVNMQAQRSPAPPVAGIETDSYDDDSVILLEPQGAAIGATYNGQTIRHIRWSWTAERFQAQLYFVPFIFRAAPEQSIYSGQFSAAVQKMNGDGSVDLIVSGRFGITGVPLYSGLPGCKVEVKPGELVTLGFFGSNPQAPFAMAHGQNVGAAKAIARATDPVDIGQFVFASSIATDLIVTWTPPVGSIPPVAPPVGVGAPLKVTGLIKSGSKRAALDDG